MPNKNRAKTKSVRKRPLTSKSYVWFLAIIPVLAVAIALTTFNSDKPKTTPTPACGVYRNDKAVHVGSTTLNAEVASTPLARNKGLSGRPCILPSQAMLFAFPTPGKYAFWMKDMHFPIDILWIGSNHRVVGFEFDVKPSTYPDKFVNQTAPAQYVLELKANHSKDLGITSGTLINF